MREKISGIYCIENMINNKKYIGLSVDIYRRWSNHICELDGNYHINVHLQNAWNKYKKENFKFYILEKCEQDILCEREKFWIAYYDTYKNGYNRTLGGEGTVGLIISEERKKEMLKYIIGRPCSERTRGLFRKHMLEQFKDENFLAKFRENIDSQKEPIKCYSQNGFIKSYTDIHSAARDLKVEATNICKVLKRKHKTCGGYTFCYAYESLSEAELKERYTKEIVKRRGCTSPVDLIDENGDIVKHYLSLKEASDDNGCIDTSSIAKVCKGKLKTTHGLIFQYANGLYC